MTNTSCRRWAVAWAVAAVAASSALAGCAAGRRLLGGGGDPCCTPCPNPCVDPCANPCAEVAAPPAAPASDAPKAPAAPVAAIAPVAPGTPDVPAALVAPEVPVAPAAAEAASPAIAGPAGPATVTPEGRSLFDRIGGEGGVTSLVDGFIRTIATDNRVTSNPLVKRRMKRVSIATLRQHFIDQLCELTGGPKRYSGRDMKSSHEGLQISVAEWDAGIEDLSSAMNGCGFGEREQREILDLIRPMKSQIVEIP